MNKKRVLCVSGACVHNVHEYYTGLLEIVQREGEEEETLGGWQEEKGVHEEAQTRAHSLVHQPGNWRARERASERTSKREQRRVVVLGGDYRP